jgi:hypothetical protein
VWDQLFRLPAKDVLTAQNVTGVIVPPSQIVTNVAIVSAPQLATLYERLAAPSSGHGATGTHNIELLGSNAIDNGSTLALSKTLPLTVKVGPNLVIEVLFKNTGSSPEVNVPVTLAVKAAGKILPGSTETKKVAQIAAGAQATVSFTNPQVPNTAFSRTGIALFVKVGPVPHEANLSDNFATYPVFFQIAPPS